MSANRIDELLELIQKKINNTPDQSKAAKLADLKAGIMAMTAAGDASSNTTDDQGTQHDRIVEINEPYPEPTGQQHGSTAQDERPARKSLVSKMNRQPVTLAIDQSKLDAQKKLELQAIDEIIKQVQSGNSDSTLPRDQPLSLTEQLSKLSLERPPDTNNVGQAKNFADVQLKPNEKKESVSVPGKAKVGGASEFAQKLQAMKAKNQSNAAEQNAKPNRLMKDKIVEHFDYFPEQKTSSTARKDEEKKEHEGSDVGESEDSMPIKDESVSGSTDYLMSIKEIRQAYIEMYRKRQARQQLEAYENGEYQDDEQSRTE